MTDTTIESAVVALLLADTATIAFIANRIHPATDPQNLARPKLTYQRIRSKADTANGGFSNNGPTGFEVATLQIDCWADSMLTAKQTIRAARNALNGYAGTVNGINIGCIRKTDERELPAELYPGKTKPPQRYMLEINISFTTP